MNWLYGPAELDFFGKIKRAFDPRDLANPDKILPVAEEKPAGSAGLTDKAYLSPEARGIIDELKLRHRTGTRTAVTGLGTRLKTDRIMEGAKPLALRQLAGAPEIDRENLTVRAEAGLPLKELRRQLKACGLDIELPEEGSVGGLIASKTLPGLRRILLGLDIAAADGTLMKFGGTTVKNVAGYDVVRLLCGSLGAYAVILAATFSVSARAARTPQEGAAEFNDAFDPDEYHRRLKKELDPQNLLNPWIYRENAR